jgi:diaminopimelate decarboxylase
MDPAPLLAGLELGLELAAESARRGVPLGLFNLGGGFGVDYEGSGREFPLEDYARRLGERARGHGLALVVEPGRWVVASAGVLVAEVLWVKPRDGRRFVVLAAGMNDLIRPALYHARHRIAPVRARAGETQPAIVVGPVCESADVFASDVALPPLEPGDLVAILDAGAYGSAMASNYNGRGRLAELTVSGGRLTRARAGETPRDLAGRRTRDPLPL